MTLNQGNSGGSSLKTQSQPCLLCLERTLKLSVNDPNLSSTPNWNIFSAWVTPQWSPGARTNCKLLETEVWIMFLVRKLLGVDSSTCGKLLARFGSPSEWLTICEECGYIVRKARQVYGRIVELERILQKLRRDARGRIFESSVKEGWRKQSFRISEATLKIRNAARKDLKCDAEKRVENRNHGETIQLEPPLTPVKEEHVEDNDWMDINEVTDNLSDPDYIPDLPFDLNVFEDAEVYTRVEEHSPSSDYDRPSPPTSLKRKRKRGEPRVMPLNPKRLNAVINEINKKGDSQNDDLEFQMNVRTGARSQQRRCVYCTQVFENLADFRDHCIEDHAMYACTHCPRLFVTEHNLQVHLRKRHGVNSTKGRACGETKALWRCRLCNFTATKKDNYTRHMRVIHWESTLSHTRGLGKKDTRRKRKCMQCKKFFCGMQALKAHCKSEHDMLQCQKCPGIFPNLTKLHKHETQVHGIVHKKVEPKPLEQPVKTYKCSHCTYRTTNMGKLKLHNRSLHWEVNDLGYKVKCEKCLQEFDTIEAMCTHKVEEHGMFQCSKCRKVVLSVGYLEIHEKRYHSAESAAKWSEKSAKEQHLPIKRKTGDEARKCKVCQKVFQSIKKCHEHEKDHAKETFSCDKCSKKFTSQGRLNVHKMRIHKEAKTPYKCDLCPYTNMKIGSLKKHEQRVHNKNPRVVCEICSSTFTSEQYLKFHKIRVHGEGETDDNNPLMCKICNRIFSTPQYLRGHIQGVHEGKWRYKCDECGTGFRGTKQVEIHRRIVHLKIFPYKCDREGCNRAFASNSQLNIHIRRIHQENKTRQFKCSFCGLGFVDKNQWQRHEEIHTNATSKPYQCQHCGKGFAVGNYLRQHFRKGACRMYGSTRTEAGLRGNNRNPVFVKEESTELSGDKIGEVEPEHMKQSAFNQ